MNLQAFGPYLELGFKDKLSGKHYVNLGEGDGTTSIVLPDTFAYSDLPCKVSFPKPELPNDFSEDHDPLKVNIKIFCKYDAPIKAGDYVEVSVMSNATVLATYSGKIGLPNVYDTHKEVLLAVDRSA